MPEGTLFPVNDLGRFTVTEEGIKCGLCGRVDFVRRHNYEVHVEVVVLTILGLFAAHAQFPHTTETRVACFFLFGDQRVPFTGNLGFGVLILIEWFWFSV